MDGVTLGIWSLARNEFVVFSLLRLTAGEQSITP